MVVKRMAVLSAGLSMLAAPAGVSADPGVRILRRDYLHSGLRLYGRVVRLSGRPDAGVPVRAVSSTLTGAGGVTVATGVTGRRGRYGLIVPPGPPRMVTVWTGSGAVQRVVRELVAPSVWFRAVSRRGGRITFYGRLWGPPATVVMKDRTSSGGWATFAVRPSSSRGTFVIRYRAPRALAGLRVLVRATTWPTAWRSGASRPRWITVR